MDKRVVKYILVIIVIVVVLGMIGWRMKKKVEDYAATVPEDTITISVEEMDSIPEQPLN